MTTENTTTESTSAEASMTPYEFAMDFIKNNSVTEIAEKLVTYSESVDNLNARIARQVSENERLRSRLQETVDAVTAFLKQHIGDDDSASVEELEQLAEELDIELTKTITVSMRVDIEVEMTVPLNFHEDSISESDFDISCDFRNHIDDVESDDISIEVNSFDVEEN